MRNWKVNYSKSYWNVKRNNPDFEIHNFSGISFNYYFKNLLVCLVWFRQFHICGEDLISRVIPTIFFICNLRKEYRVKLWPIYGYGILKFVLLAFIQTGHISVENRVHIKKVSRKNLNHNERMLVNFQKTHNYFSPKSFQKSTILEFEIHVWTVLEKTS